MKVGAFFRELFSGVRGEISSKRAVVLIAFILLCVAFISNLFFGYVIAEFIFENFVYIVLAGLGLATAEPIAAYFSNRK